MFNNKSLSPIILCIMAIILFFCLNIIADLGFKRFKIDMTDDHLFSMSSKAVEIIRKYHEPITFKLFFSNRAANGFPALKSYADRIQGFLEEFVQKSNGNIKLQIIDPQPFSEEEDLATSYGLKGVDLNNGQKVYFGLVATNSTDDVSTVPVFVLEREKFLEYDLVKMVYSLSNPKKSTVGVMTGLSMDTPMLFGNMPIPGGNGWVILEQMRQIFNVVPVKDDAEAIPDNIDVLMVAQPKGLTDKSLYAIDQFVLKGGHTLFFVDPNVENKGGSTRTDLPYPSMLNRLFNSWGVNIDPEKIVTDRLAGRKVQDDSSQKGYVEYIAWLNMRDKNLNHSEVTTSVLKELNFATAGSIEKTGKTNINFIPLVSTSKESMLMSKEFFSGIPKPNDLLKAFVPANKEFVLAARLSGEVPSAFSAGLPNGTINSNNLTKSKGSINVFIIADTDILRDDLWLTLQDLQGYKVIQTSADNGSFVVNILDYLSGSDDLIALRGRGAAIRPFTVVEALKRNAEEKFLSKEEELKERLAVTEKKLQQLQTMKGNDASLVNGQQIAEIERFRQEHTQISRQLRGVQAELNKEIEKLGSLLKFINIFVMPLLVIVFAISFFIIRKDLNKSHSNYKFKM